MHAYMINVCIYVCMHTFMKLNNLPGLDLSVTSAHRVMKTNNEEIIEK